MTLLNLIPEPEIFAKIINYTDSIETAKALLLTSKHFSKIINSMRLFITIDLSYERFKNNDDFQIENEVSEVNVHGLMPENEHEIIAETLLPAGVGIFYHLINHQDLGYIITSCVVSSNFTKMKINIGGIPFLTLSKSFLDIFLESSLDLMYFMRCLPYASPNYHDYCLCYDSIEPVKLKIIKKRWNVEEHFKIVYRVNECQQYIWYLSSNNNQFEIKPIIRHVIKGIFFRIEYDNKINNEILQSITVKLDEHKSYKITADLLKCDNEKNIVPIKVKNCYYLELNDKIDFSKVKDTTFTLETKGNMEPSKNLICMIFCLGSNFMHKQSGLLFEHL